jgi:hypothetical protein
MAHAQLNILLIDRAVALEKPLARWRITEKMGVKLGDNVGKMFFNNGLGLTDCGGIFCGKTDEFGHITKILSCIFGALFGGKALLTGSTHGFLLGLACNNVVAATIIAHMSCCAQS